MGQKSIIAVIVLVIAIIVFGVLLALRGSNPASKAKNNVVSAVATKTIVNASDITGDPLVYDGLNVEVESGVNSWVTKKSFMVTSSGGAFGSGGRSLLVVAKSPFALLEKTSPTQLSLGEKVKVHLKGKVTILSKEQLAKELGVDFESDEFKLDDNNIRSWTLGPVLILDSVEKI